MASEPANEAGNRLLVDVVLGEDVVIGPFTNLYGCEIGDGTRVGPFVEIQRGARIGRRCKVQSHTFVCEGVTIEDEVFVGHGVMFVNDKYPRATTSGGALQTGADWTLLETVVERGASLGSGAVVLGGVRIGAGAAPSSPRKFERVRSSRARRPAPCRAHRPSRTSEELALWGGGRVYLLETSCSEGGSQNGC